MVCWFANLPIVDDDVVSGSPSVSWHHGEPLSANGTVQPNLEPVPSGNCIRGDGQCARIGHRLALRPVVGWVEILEGRVVILGNQRAVASTKMDEDRILLIDSAQCPPVPGGPQVRTRQRLG